jgi:L-alanine-DL-glutamate epimerase-like enolase superfamily enzyme
MSARPLKALPLASAHKISAVTISHHRLPLAPAFNASWDTQPRVHFDATIVRVSTDSGLVGVGSGDLMLGFGGHEQLFVGRDPLALERHYRVLSNIDFHYGRCWPLDLALWDLRAACARTLPAEHCVIRPRRRTPPSFTWRRAFLP